MLIKSNNIIDAENAAQPAVEVSNPAAEMQEPVAVPAAEPPKAVKSEKTASSDNRVKMLVMSFVTLMCIAFLPLFTVSTPFVGEVNMYAADITRVAGVGVEMEEMREGQLVMQVQQSVAESIAKEQNPQARMLVEQMGDKFIQLAENAEPRIIQLATELKKVFIGMYIAAFFAIVGILGLLVFAAKNMKKMYMLTNAALFVLFVGVSAAAGMYTDLGKDICGNGMWLSLLMLVLNCIIPFRKKKKA